MKHNLQQVKSAKKNLIDHHQYKESDFYTTEDDIICINSEDLELSSYDVYMEKQLARKEKSESVWNEVSDFNFFAEK